MAYFKTEDLAVGYDGAALIRDINISLERGKILTLIGPNGAGKSTVLKSMARQLSPICGAVYINKREISSMTPRQLSREMSVVLTERVRSELLTCAEVVAMGRYPYTDMFGRLSAGDKAAVKDALLKVRASELADKDFFTLSDGQKQRIMLARAICQEPKVMLLDEPTAYLDIRYKIELLEILREMARSGVTVIMSLHEIDLAVKASDYLVCLKGDKIEAFGSPEDILGDDTIERLYDLEKGSYDLLFGSVELKKPKGAPRVFVVSGAGRGIPFYRALQKRGIPFATGVLFENDVDMYAAKRLSDCIISAPAFELVSEERFNKAADVLLKCSAVIDAGTPVGTFNLPNARLVELAGKRGMPIYKSIGAVLNENV